MSEAHGYVYTELMKNSDIIGTRYADSTTITVWDFATGVVVVDVSQGDHIYIRMEIPSRGKVLSKSSRLNSWLFFLINVNIINMNSNLIKCLI